MFKDCGQLPPAKQEESEAVTQILANQTAASIVIDQSLDAIFLFLVTAIQILLVTVCTKEI